MDISPASIATAQCASTTTLSLVSSMPVQRACEEARFNGPMTQMLAISSLAD